MMEIFRNIAGTLFWFLAAVVMLWILMFILSVIVESVKKGMKKDE